MPSFRRRTAPCRAVEQIPVEVGTLTDSGTPIKGKLQLIDNEVDASSGTIGVRAVFDNPGGRLIPGQFVRVRMGQPKAENKIVVSDRAVGTDQDKKFVFVVDGENKVAYRQVQLGTLADGQRVVEGGLNAGEKIVVNGLQRIRPVRGRRASDGREGRDRAVKTFAFSLRGEGRYPK